jgi:hypothetical protein
VLINGWRTRNVGRVLDGNYMDKQFILMFLWMGKKVMPSMGKDLNMMEAEEEPARETLGGTITRPVPPLGVLLSVIIVALLLGVRYLLLQCVKHKLNITINYITPNP